MKRVLLRQTLIAATAVSLVACACGKSEPTKPKDFFAQPPKVEYDIKITPEEPTAAAPAADTWAGKTRDLVKQAQEDLARCRNEYLTPFQFDKMRRRNVEFVNIGEMDAVCYDGSEDGKKSGPHRLLNALGEEIGKNPILDRYIAFANDQLEHYRVFGFMVKKVGAPNIGPITDTAKAMRDRILIAGGQLDGLAAEIDKWPAGLKSDDDPSNIGQSIEITALRQQLLQTYGWLMKDLVATYDRDAAKSWEAPNMVKLAALKVWVGIALKRLTQDRARLQHVTPANDKGLTEVKAYFDAVEAACKQVQAGYERYDKYHESLPEVDPNHKPLEKAAAAVIKIQSAWEK